MRSALPPHPVPGRDDQQAIGRARHELGRLVGDAGLRRRRRAGSGRGAGPGLGCRREQSRGRCEARWSPASPRTSLCRIVHVTCGPSTLRDPARRVRCGTGMLDRTRSVAMTHRSHATQYFRRWLRRGPKPAAYEPSVDSRMCVSDVWGFGSSALRWSRLGLGGRAGPAGVSARRPAGHRGRHHDARPARDRRGRSRLAAADPGARFAALIVALGFATLLCCCRPSAACSTSCWRSARRP